MSHFYELIRDGVESQVRELDPADDILPILAYLDGAGQRNILGFAIDGSLRDEAAALITANLLVDEATEACYASFVWGVIETRPEVVEQTRDTGGWAGPMPSEHPDRVEKAMIAHYTRDGAAMYFADIIRSTDAAPTLGEWVADDFDRLGGRIARAMEAGIGMSATMPDELRAAIRAAKAADCRDAAIRGVISAMVS